ncbi:hypothetical protein QQP08_027634 [Theobroma cacao]|nr:hypothetical protein QQP08_027634 [Theobroma cacao]
MNFDSILMAVLLALTLGFKLLQGDAGLLGDKVGDIAKHAAEGALVYCCCNNFDGVVSQRMWLQPWPDPGLLEKSHGVAKHFNNPGCRIHQRSGLNQIQCHKVEQQSKETVWNTMQTLHVIL